jgi:hypothetical protein
MRPLMFVILLCICNVALADGVGIFSEVSGDTRIQRGDDYYAAAQGVEVDVDDIVETGADAAAQIEMKDGSVLKLGAGSRLLVADYRLDPDGNVLTAGLDVLSGWLRFAVAKLHGSGTHYDISTPTMTIGIRGTEGVIEAANQQGSLYLEKGAVAVHAVDAGSVPVSAGQYIERARGRAFARPEAMPAAFRARMPQGLRQFLERHPQWLRRHSVPPRRIRGLARADRERYLHEHPQWREQLTERFRAHGHITPQQREIWRQRRLQQHEQQFSPERRRERLRHRPHLIPSTEQP